MEYKLSEVIDRFKPYGNENNDNLSFNLIDEENGTKTLHIKNVIFYDKDILYPNCHIYSSETCILTPQRINMLFSNKPNNRGLPNGIYKIKNGYMAKYQGNKIGRYSILDEAYDAYSTAKENNIKEVADEYKNIIPKKLYDALYAYKVDINNDKNYKVS